jgi:hypothetical protein
MHLIVRVLSMLAGFIFTIGGAAKTSAQEFRPTPSGTAVIARQNPTMNSSEYEMARKRLVTVLAAQPGKPPPGKPPPDTKPTKKTKSPKEYLP